jgi:tetratricopeptide (TPR) repeat protein
MWYHFRVTRNMRKICIFLLLSIILPAGFIGLAHAKIPELWTVPDKVPHYVDRPELSRNLMDFFAANLHGKMAITGISGIGKSELAIDYAFRTYNAYDIVWWFDGKREFLPQFHQFAIDWNATFPDPKDQIPLEKLSVTGVTGFMKNLLRKTNKSWLIIFDNASSAESIAKYLPTVHKGDPQKKHILITSQNKHDWFHQLPMNIFTEEEVRLYVSSALKEASLEQIAEIVEVIERLPFYLVRDIRDIASKRIRIEDYIGKGGTRSKESEMKQAGVERANVNFMEKLQFIRESSPAAYSLLVLLSLKQGLSLPKPILEKFLSIRHPDASLASTEMILGEGSFLQELKARDNSAVLNSVHDIVQKTVRGQISDAVALDYTNILTDILASILDTPWEDLVSYTSDNPATIALAHVVWDLARSEGAVNERLFCLGISLMEYHLFKTRDHNTYEEISRELEVLLSKLGPANIDVSTLCEFYITSVYVRGIYKDKDRCALAEKNFLAAIQQFKSSENRDLYLRTLTSIAQYYLFCGNLEEAEKYLKQAEPVLLEAKSLSNKNFYWYIRSWVYMEAGDFVECHRCLDIFFSSEDKEKNTAIKLYASNMKANACFATGQHEETFLWCNTSLKGALEYFQNEESEITAEALMIKAKATLAQKDHLGARELLMKAIPTYDKYFGGAEIHPDQAIALRLMGETYVREDDDATAMTYFAKAMNTYDKLYGKEFNGMKEVSSLLVLMSIAALNMNLEDVVQKCLHLQTKNFGIDHSGTQEIFFVLDHKKMKTSGQ